jgi:stage III sporulation protein AG
MGVRGRGAARWPGGAGEVGGRWRLIVALGAAGLLLVLLSGLVGTGSSVPRARARLAPARPRAAAPAPAAPTDPVLAYEADLDAYVAGVLDQVAGAGKVWVAVTVARSPSRQLARDTSLSRQVQGGGVDTSEQQALAYGPGQVPVATGETAPPVVGAVVVAPGAQSPAVRAELTQAVETLLGLAANQVFVLPGRRGVDGG